MFTGLVETVGTLCGRGAERLRIRPAKKLEALRYGESVAVNGCCLTLERELPDGTLEFYTLSETLKRTNLGLLPVGAKLNMERALRLGDRLGGHIVSGHVDETAEVISYSKRADGDYELKLTLPASLAREVVEKGSVAIDGVSLTVVEAAAPEGYEVSSAPVVMKCPDRAAEYKEAAKRIASYVYGGGRYDDIAIVDGSGEYHAAKRIFDEFGIPYYTGEKLPLAGTELGRFIFAALECARRKYRTANMLALSNNAYSGRPRRGLFQMLRQSLLRGLPRLYRAVRASRRYGNGCLRGRGTRTRAAYETAVGD